ncbi:hypothetical protein [Streptomyces sp. NPDC001404]|uniref:hypothetical protein n=1 Tax=Streptomyces sp. NPDC001404 TaxID=3364571 RepID=UPI003680C5E0
MTALAAVLPSRDEATTIGAVTAAVDRALDDPDAVIVNADSSTHPATSRAFAATPTLAHKVALTGLPAGKGRQIFASLEHVPRDAIVLLADTDTRNPAQAMYRALLDAALTGAGCAVADYRRYWDEANLTHHIARPLLAATGTDLAQPLAGDMALAPRAASRAARERNALNGPLAVCVDGYGIDAFLVINAVRTGQPAVGVPLGRTKEHAPSFPHLPVIFTEAVPVLLALTGSPLAPTDPAEVSYALADRDLSRSQLDAMLGGLDSFLTAADPAPVQQWPLPLLEAWRWVRSGISPVEAATTLWPSYLQRVRTWLSVGTVTPLDTRRASLAEAHIRLGQWMADDHRRRS